MTTISEVKRWTAGILAEHSHLVLEGRDLHLLPLNHIFRSIRFLGSSQRTFPTPSAMFGLLFAPPSVSMSHSLGLDLRVGYSTESHFQQRLDEEVRHVLDRLRRLGSVESFYELTLVDDLIWDVLCTGLSWSPLLQATTLAALGKLSEASAVAEAYVENADEPQLLELLASGQEIQAKRPRSSDASYRIGTATTFLQRLNDIRLISELTVAGDRTGIAALLRTWELDRVQRLGLEHLWEPTPFPLERAR